MDPILGMFGTASKIYNAAALIIEIDKISKSISAVYSDIAEAHFETALQAFKAASHSSNAEREIGHAINSLRSAYNINSKLIGKTRTVGFFFLSHEEPYITNKELFYNELTKISAIIFWLYRDLSENENSLLWHDKAISNFKIFIEHYIFSIADLRSFSPDYVYKSVEDVGPDFPTIVNGMFGDDVSETVIRTRISAAGQEFTKRQKIELTKRFPKYLHSKKVDFDFQSIKRDGA